MALTIGIRRIGTDSLELGIHSKPVGLSLRSDSLVVLTGPQMAAAVTDPSLTSWQLDGFDQGPTLALGIMQGTSDEACEVQYKLYNPVSRNSYLGTRTALGTAHNDTFFVTDNADRGALLQLSWRWWYDGRQSDGPFILLDSSVTIPIWGGDPTTNP